MFRLVVIAFNELWRAEEVRLLALKQRNDEFESALAVQRKFDGTLTFNSVDQLNAKGLEEQSFWKRLRGLIFQSPPLATTSQFSSAFTETLSGVGIRMPFVEQIASHLQPGTSILMILVEERQAESMRSLAKQNGGTCFENDVANNDLSALSRTIEGKIIEITKRAK